METLHPVDMKIHEPYVLVTLILDHKAKTLGVERWEVVTSAIDEVKNTKSFILKRIQTTNSLRESYVTKVIVDFNTVPKIDGVEMFLVFDTIAKSDTYMDYLADLYKTFDLVNLSWKEVLAHLKTAFFRKTQRFQADEAEHRRDLRMTIRNLGC